MLFILAVEPDETKVAHVTAMTQRSDTELEIAGSSTAALCAMVARLPDLVLISRALPQQDERRVRSFIEELGPAAAHVRVFATPRAVQSASPTADAAGAPLGDATAMTQETLSSPTVSPSTPAGSGVVLTGEQGRCLPLSTISSAQTPDAKDGPGPKEPPRVRLVTRAQPA